MTGEPVHVLEFIDSLDPGGAESMLVDLSSALRELGLAVTIGHFGNASLAERCVELELPQLIIDNHAAFKSMTSLPRFARSLANQTKRAGFNAIHAHLYGASVAAAIAGRMTRARIVGTLHDSYTLVERPSRIRLLQLAAFAGVRLVSVARYMEVMFAEMARFPSGAWRTIHNGIDTARFTPLQSGGARMSDEERAHRRAELCMPAHGVLVGSVGRLVRLKRFDTLIQAVASANLPATLVIVGDGPEKHELQTLVNRLGVGDRVVLLGQRRDVHEILPLLDVFTLWSETEGLSCSIAEAMACELPCVVSDVGGNRELITPNKTGYLVPPNDSTALVDRLADLCRDISLRRRLGKAARSTVEREFSLTAMARAYAEMLAPGHAAIRPERPS